MIRTTDLPSDSGSFIRDSGMESSIGGEGGMLKDLVGGHINIFFVFPIEWGSKEEVIYLVWKSCSYIKKKMHV